MFKRFAASLVFSLALVAFGAPALERLRLRDQ